MIRHEERSCLKPKIEIGDGVELLVENEVEVSTTSAQSCESTAEVTQPHHLPWRVKGSHRRSRANRIDTKGRKLVWIAWTRYFLSLYRQAEAFPLTVMNDWLLVKPVHVTEFIHGNISLFAKKSHVATCVVESGGSYFDVMQLVSKEKEPEMEIDNI